jgi:hypothetical protein
MKLSNALPASYSITHILPPKYNLCQDNSPILNRKSFYTTDKTYLHIQHKDSQPAKHAPNAIISTKIKKGRRQKPPALNAAKYTLILKAHIAK